MVQHLAVFTNYSPHASFVQYDPNLMSCRNTGPLHLGLSEEACENAGGKWFRTPCITLKEAIDARPFKFNISNPVPSGCQDALLQVNTAYVKASAHHTEFPFDSDEQGCNEFCRSLPEYTAQIAMMASRQPSPVRKVRVEIDRVEILSLAEVEVYDHAGVNRALDKPATESSIYNTGNPDDAMKAVNGNLNDITHTLREAGKYKV